MFQRKLDRATRQAMASTDGFMWRGTLVGHLKRLRCYLFGHDLEQFVEMVDYEDGLEEHMEMHVRCLRCFTGGVVFCWDCG